MNYSSHANDNGTLNITLSMEVVPATCESDIPLMNVSVMDDTTDGEYSSPERVAPLRGGGGWDRV